MVLSFKFLWFKKKVIELHFALFQNECNIFKKIRKPLVIIFKK